MLGSIFWDRSRFEDLGLQVVSSSRRKAFLDELLCEVEHPVASSLPSEVEQLAMDLRSPKALGALLQVRRREEEEGLTWLESIDY
jgi:hypothetical protein